MLLSASFTCLDACCCHGLRLPVFNKETTYLLTYLLTLTGRPSKKINWRLAANSVGTGHGRWCVRGDRWQTNESEGRLWIEVGGGLGGR